MRNINFGINVNFNKPYLSNVDFCIDNGFNFLQIWYDKNGFAVYENNDEILEIIKNTNFPSIIHAVIDINDYEIMIPKLKTILDFLDHKELIIHPICKSENQSSNTNIKLTNKFNYVRNTLNNLIIYIENNSKLDPIFQTNSDIEYFFKKNPDVEFLMDLAHIDNYDHLRKMIETKRPKVFHISDRNLENIHEHLPIGDGNIDFDLIFNEIIPDFNDKLIFELIFSDDLILNSKDKIVNVLNNNNTN